MIQLQITDSYLFRAVDEYFTHHQAPEIALTQGDADVKITINDNIVSLLADGHEVDSHELPLRFSALMADLHWLAARRREDAQKSISLNADYILEPHDFRLRSGGLQVTLTGREVTLLQFMQSAGESTKEELLMHVWQYHPESMTHTVETHLWRLRQKLQQAGMEAALIITTDKGYRIA